MEALFHSYATPTSATRTTCTCRWPSRSGVRGDASLPHQQYHLAGSPFAPFSGCSGTPASTQSSSASQEAHHTNNIVTEDKWGDIVAYTNTINFFGGSGQVVPGYGFLLNDELTDFDFAPSSPGAYDPNLPAPGKEPRSSMGPVIALRERPVPSSRSAPPGARRSSRPSSRSSSTTSTSG